MSTQSPSVPFSSPPRPVRLVVFELTQEEARDKDFVDSTLDEDEGYHTKHGVRGVPEFKEPLEKGKGEGNKS